MSIKVEISETGGWDFSATVEMTKWCFAYGDPSATLRSAQDDMVNYVMSTGALAEQRHPDRMNYCKRSLRFGRDDNIMGRNDIIMEMTI